jgi:GH24 family phage-related lysozyme (muramidase)
MDALLAKIIEHEGCVKHLYCDHLGNVTCGVGFLMRTPGTLYRFAWDDLGLAIDDWHRVKRCYEAWATTTREHGPRTARGYQKLTAARLLDVETPLRELVWSFKLQLQTRGLPLDTFPLPVQEAVLDMAYNLGVGGLLSKFPKFVSHLKAGNYAAASTECRRPQVSAARNAWTRKQLRST